MKKTKKVKRKYKKGVVIQSYLAISPQIIGFFVFSVYPILWILGYSFTDYNGARASFVGISNYIEILTDDETFVLSVVNTLALTVMKLVMEIPLAFLLAMLINTKRLRGKRLLSTLLFLPSIVGVSSAGMMFSYMFRTYNGLFNNLLEALGAISGPVNWFGERWSALFVVALMSTWMTFPINMMYFSGAIAGVSEDVYESAELDGCGKVHRIFSITLPMIAPTFKVIFMLALIGTMKIMNEVMILTGGGPRGQTNVVMLYLYNMFFATSADSLSSAQKIGYASAGSIVVTIFIGIITMFYLKMTRKADELY